MWYLPAANAQGDFLTRPGQWGPWFLFVHAPYSYAVIGMAMLTLGCALLIAGTVVFLTDVLYVWSVGSRMLFFLTPIFYSVDLIDMPLAVRIIELNPLTPLVELGRKCVLDGQPLGMDEMAAGLAGPAVLLLVGLVLFQALKRRLPDYI